MSGLAYLSLMHNWDTDPLLKEIGMLNIAKKIHRGLLALKSPRFTVLKIRTRGMLTPALYQKIYRSIYKMPDYDIVEVGAALGASSVAIALGIKDSKKRSKVIVVEKCEGGRELMWGAMIKTIGY